MGEDQYGRQENFLTAMLWTVNTTKLVLESKCDGEFFLTKMDKYKNGRQPKLEDNTNGRIEEAKITDKYRPQIWTWVNY